MQSKPTDRRPVSRLPRDESDPQPRYFHPNGYVIERWRRSWSERGREPGRHHDPPPPLYQWTVFHHIAKRRAMLVGRPALFRTVVSEQHHPKEFDTLRDARAWCDEHPREGWPSDSAAPPRKDA